MSQSSHDGRPAPEPASWRGEGSVTKVMGYGCRPVLANEGKALEMSLQFRLTFFFSLVLILPLAVAGGVLRSATVVVILSVVAVAVLAYLIANLVTKPLRQLAAGARALAEGRFDHRLDFEAEGEIGELATAFNDTASRLSDTIAELSASREQLQLAVQQVAKTFRSTHNMEQILEALVDTAVQAVQADAAVLWRFAPTRQELYPAVRRGLSEEPATVRLGRGLVGVVAERGTPLLETTRDREHSEVHAEYR